MTPDDQTPSASTTFDSSRLPAPQYPVEAVDRALRLLALFGDRAELRLSQVRAELGVGQSTAHRLMAMLVYRGFAVQDPMTRVYHVGPALVNVGLAAARNFDLRAAGRPILERLAAGTGETVHLGTLEGVRVRYLDCVESPALLRVGSRVGSTGPAHATSLGKAMLATLHDDDVRARYESDRLPGVTSHTITSMEELLTELASIRTDGFAVNRQGMEEGVCSVAVPVTFTTRGVVAALSVAAPASRIDAQWVTDEAARLSAAAADLATAI